MELELVDFELAKMLKEVGFKEMCFHYYYKDGKLKEPYLENGSSTDTDFRVDLEDLLDDYSCSSDRYNAPTLELAKMWFMEVHGIMIQTDYGSVSEKYWFYILELKTGDSLEEDLEEEEGAFKTYNQALSAGLKECCKLIKNK